MAKKSRTPPPPRPVQAPQRRDQPSGRKPLDRRLLWGGLALLVLIGVGVGLGVALAGGGSSKSSSTASASGPKIDWTTLPGRQDGPPPWSNDSATLPDRVVQLGLNQLPQEGGAVHIHQHLDLYVDGKQVPLPAGVGIYGSNFITELHTHDASGLIHVESPTKTTFTLGQLFGEWGVRLTSRCVGSSCGKLSWWVNGAQQAGDPADLELASHQVIVVALGKPPATVRKTYAWNGA